MPKTTRIIPRRLRSYDPLSRLSPEDLKAIGNTLLIDTSFIWKNEGAQKYYIHNQDTLFLHEAVCRATGLHKLQQPVIDHFQAQGRTIYNAHYHYDHDYDYHHNNHHLLTILSNMLSSSAEEKGKIVAEPHTPPRRRSANTQRKVHSSKSAEHQAQSLDIDLFNPSNPDPALQPTTFFIAITKNREIELLPERIIPITATHFEKAECTSDPFGSPHPGPMDEDTEGVSRCSTPSLSWSDSVNSSPSTDLTEGWNEGINGPTRARIDPINYGTAAGKSTSFSPSSGYDGLANEEDLFNLYINAEECEIP